MHSRLHLKSRKLNQSALQNCTVIDVWCRDFSISICVRISWARVGCRDDALPLLCGALCEACVTCQSHGLWFHLQIIFPSARIFLFFFKSLCLALFLASPCNWRYTHASQHRTTTFMRAPIPNVHFGPLNSLSYFSCSTFFDFCFLYNLKFSFWLFYGSSDAEGEMQSSAKQLIY